MQNKYPRKKKKNFFEQNYSNPYIDYKIYIIFKISVNIFKRFKKRKRKKT